MLQGLEKFGWCSDRFVMPIFQIYMISLFVQRDPPKEVKPIVSESVQDCFLFTKE